MPRITAFTSLAALLIGASGWGQEQNSLAAIREALTAKYALTTTTADKSDIVTPGAVLVLKKSNLLTLEVTNAILYSNTYKNGRITQGFLGQMEKNGEGTRTFVSGEKLWVTGIDIKEKGVVFSLYTDAYADVRYRALLMFPFAKGASPSAGEVAAKVSEVFDIQPSDDAKTPVPATPVAAAAPLTPPQPSAVTPPPPIAPPPPPPPDPKTIALKQTIDQVVANFGQPDKIIKLATKQIYVYKDMKVTFVAGKVTDVQ